VGGSFVGGGGGAGVVLSGVGGGWGRGGGGLVAHRGVSYKCNGGGGLLAGVFSALVALDHSHGSELLLMQKRLARKNLCDGFWS